MTTTTPAPPVVRSPPVPAPVRGAAAVTTGVAVVLVLLAAGLWVVLPDQASVGNWALAWAGFDAGVAAMSLLTGVLLRRGDPRAALAAVGTAALLVADAWFDVTTAAGGAGAALAVTEAALVELPLAAAGVWLALRLFDRGRA